MRLASALIVLIVLFGTGGGYASAHEPASNKKSKAEAQFAEVEWRRLKETSNALLDDRANISELQVRVNYSGDGIADYQREEFNNNVQHAIDMAQLSVSANPNLPILKIEARGTSKQAGYGTYLVYSRAEVVVHAELVLPRAQVFEMETTYRNKHPIHLREDAIKRNIDPGGLAYKDIFYGGNPGGKNQLTRDLVGFFIRAFGPRIYENMLSRSNELADYRYAPGRFDAERANAANKAAYFLTSALETNICGICWVRFKSGNKAALEIENIVPASAPPHFPKESRPYAALRSGFDDLRSKIRTQSKIASRIQYLIDILESGQEGPATYKTLRNLSGKDWGDHPKKWAEWWYSTSW